MKQRFKNGDSVMMTEDAAEHYGELHGKDYGAEVFTITGAAGSTKEHPGYDSGVGEALYDLSDMSGKPFQNSLYDYELERA